MPTGGLCNYLRVIFSYNEYAKHNHAKLMVVWNVTSECNGNFMDYFEPIPNVRIISVLGGNNPLHTKIYYRGGETHPKFRPNYKDLSLLPYMEKIIQTRVNILRVPYTSIHIRRTDHQRLAKKVNKFTTDNDFIKFIEKYKENGSLYIASDNKKTYDKFKQKYNNLVKFEYHKSNQYCLRHTSLQNAIIDIYMCVHSANFMRSGYSSFSYLILELRKK
jgi:hypothetical protein